jgi:hypothetical protein
MDIPEISRIKSQLVDFDKIDTSPGPSCMSFASDLNPLIQSINKIGLLNGPLLMESKHGLLTIIAGYRRISALKSLGWHRFPCRILSESKISPLTCLLLNLYDNLATRRLNVVEKGMVLSRLCSLVQINEVLAVYMPLLDLPSDEPTLSFFTKLETQLDTRIKEYLVQKKLSLKIAKMLLEMGSEARSQIFRVISNIKLNINQQIYLIDYIIEISIIENKSISEILNEPALEEVFANKYENNPQKAKAILKVLRARRLPSVVEAEELFNKRVSGLDLPDKVRIFAPQYFEKPDFRMEVRFKEGEGLKKTIDRLALIKGLEDIRNPWEIDS